MNTPQFDLANVLTAINSIYAQGAVNIQELDQFLKQFQNDPSAWSISIQVLQNYTLPPFVRHIFVIY